MIDIIIPTYNRPKDIAKFVLEIQKQRYSDYHVYIIDDFGVEDIKDLIPDDKTHFTYLRLPENKGQAYARNVAIAMGKGNIVVSLDDDAWFENEDALELVSDYFKNSPSLGCLMFNVRSPQEDYLSKVHNIQVDGQLIGSHITCGCAYTRVALKEINGFEGFLHSGAEETDVSLKLTAKGYDIRFAVRIKVFHNYLPAIRSKKWYRILRFNTTRNDLLIVVMRYPAKYVLKYFFGKYFSHVLYSFKNTRDRWVVGLYTILALPAALIKLPQALSRRNPLTRSSFLKWVKIRW
jgi:glycosyltransferase involved in cell wall biosynthesis